MRLVFICNWCDRALTATSCYFLNILNISCGCKLQPAKAAKRGDDWLEKCDTLRTFRRVAKPKEVTCRQKKNKWNSEFCPPSKFTEMWLWFQFLRPPWCVLYCKCELYLLFTVAAAAQTNTRILCFFYPSNNKQYTRAEGLYRHCHSRASLESNLSLKKIIVRWQLKRNRAEKE